MSALMPSAGEPQDPPPESRLVGPVPPAEHGQLIPKCPRCACDLRAKKHETGIAWQCDACGGESLNFSQFRRLIPELHANEIWMTAMERPVAPRRRARCPECRRDMAAVLIPFQGREIELDLCRGCQRLWLENQSNEKVRLDEAAEPGIKPPVIKMTGRGQERMLGEQLRRIRQRALPGRDAEEKPWHSGVGVAVLLIYVIIRILMKI